MTTPPATQLADTAIVGVTLSRDELYVVLRLIKARNIPGFDVSWAHVDVHGASTPETAAALRAAMDALVARGYVQLLPPSAPGAEPRLELPSPVVALVGACAFSSFTVRFVGIDEGVLQQFYFHQFGALGALHSTPQPGIHLFMPLDGRQGLLTAITTMVGVEGTPAIGDQLGRIPLAALRTGVRAARDRDTEGMRRALSEAAMSDASARQGLVDALTRKPIWGELSIGIRNVNGAVVERDIFTVASTGVAFMFAPQPEDPATLGIYAANADRVRDWVGAQLPSSAE